MSTCTEMEELEFNPPHPRIQSWHLGKVLNANIFFWMLVDSEEIHYVGVWEEFLPMIFGGFMHCIPSSAGVCVNLASTWEGMEGKQHIHLCHYLLLSRVTRWDICPPNQSLWPIFSYDPSTLHFYTCQYIGNAAAFWVCRIWMDLLMERDLWNQLASAFSEVFWKKPPQSSVPVKHLKINKCGGGGRKLLNQNWVICLVWHWVQRFNKAPVKCMKGTVDHCMVIGGSAILDTSF